MKRLMFSALLKRCLIVWFLVASGFSFAQIHYNQYINRGCVETEAINSVPNDFAFIPWTEGWEGSIGTSWTYFPEQGAWKVSSSIGNPAPSMSFGLNSSATDYSTSLLSIQHQAALYTCSEIYLDFDLKLDDRNQTGAEAMLVEAYWNGAWHSVAEFKNEGSFDWTHHKIAINEVAGLSTRIRFTAAGSNCHDIIAWYLDNISVTPSALPASSLEARFIDFTDSNGVVELNWDKPICPTINPATTLNYVYDDGSYENALSLAPLTNAWLGNKFPTLDYGQIEMFDVFFASNPSGQDALMTIDVFDDLGNLIGTSDPFLATPNSWLQVPVSTPIPFMDAFYAMVHWTSLNATHKLAIDENGPNVSQSLGFYKAGNSFQTLEAAFGGNPGVFLLRVTVQSAKDNAMHSIGPKVDASTSLLGYNIYRNEIKVNEIILVDTLFIDTLTIEGVYDYHVKSVHEAYNGTIESVASDLVEVIYKLYATDAPDASRNILFPNPSTGQVSVKSTKRIKSTKIFDGMGALKMKMDCIGSKEVSLRLLDYACGIYLVEITAFDMSVEMLRLALLSTK